MSIPILSNIDLNGNSILNPVLNPLATAPEHAKPYYIYTNTSDGTIYQNVGTYETPVWKAIYGDAYVKPATGIPKTDLASDVQSSIDKADAALPKSGGTMTGNIAMGSNKITGLGTPTSDADATTKKYVDDGLALKAPLASPALTGTPTAPTAPNGTSTTQIATTEFVQNAFAASDAMVFKGTIGAAAANPTITVLPDTHNAGWTYKVITAGTYAGKVCEVGDLIICIADGTVASNNDWTVAQTNIDGAVTGPASSTSGHIPTFNGASGKVIQDGYGVVTLITSDDDTSIPTAGAVYDGLATKQNTLTFDSTPTADSSNPVTSGGIKTYVDNAITNSDEVYIAIYEQTTIAELDTAYNAGKTILCKYAISERQTYYVPLIYLEHSVSGDPVTFKTYKFDTIHTSGMLLAITCETTGSSGSTNWGVNTSSTFAKTSSPAFTGVPTAPTATSGTNTTQIATTAFVQAALPVAATSEPSMDGTAAVGTSAKYAKEDHVHPTDTSRAPTNHASSATTYGKGDSSNYGHVKLSDAINSTSGVSDGVAATPAAVKSAYDLANGKSTVQVATGSIGTSATSVTVAYSGTLINAYAKIGNDNVILDIAIGSSSVVFTTSQAPSSVITCTVIYC